MRCEHIDLHKERNVTLDAYLQDVGGEFRFVTERPAVIVIPGGGYRFCSDREADPVAMPYLKAGYDVFILRYSVDENAKWPTPLQDYILLHELTHLHHPDHSDAFHAELERHLADHLAQNAENEEFKSFLPSIKASRARFPIGYTLARAIKAYRPV